jgi:hypothetical protein
MVKYTSWRYILWLQASMIAAGYLLGVPLIPAEPKVTGRKALAQCNPAGYFRVMAYPNVILVVSRAHRYLWTFSLTQSVAN